MHVLDFKICYLQNLNLVENLKMFLINVASYVYSQCVYNTVTIQC